MKLTDIFGEKIETMTSDQVNHVIDEYILYIKETVKNTNKINEKNKKKDSISNLSGIDIDIKLEKNIFIYYNEKTKKYCIKNRSINELKSLKRR